MVIRWMTFYQERQELFDGNIYKNKIEHLLTHLDKIQPGFYKGLTLDEKKSFALCLTETLKRNRLFSPSGCGMGLYSCLLAFSVGWSQELNLREFENQLERIAQEAITAWHDQDDPLTRWPYISPTAKDKAKAWCCARPSRAGIFSRAQREHKERAGMRSELKQRLTGSSINAEEDVQLLPPAFSADSATSFVLTHDNKSTLPGGLAAFKHEVDSSLRHLRERLDAHDTRLDQLEAQPLLGPDLS